MDEEKGNNDDSESVGDGADDGSTMRGRAENKKRHYERRRGNKKDVASGDKRIRRRRCK